MSFGKEHDSETQCQRHDCSLKINTLWAVRLLLVCYAHTHTHKNTFNDQLVQICPRLDTENKELFSAKKHSKYTKNTLLKALSNTLSTGWYNNGLALEVATKRSLRPGCSPDRRRQTRRIPRRAGQWSLSLGMGPGS